jgi:hypothetical protein
MTQDKGIKFNLVTGRVRCCSIINCTNALEEILFTY